MAGNLVAYLVSSSEFWLVSSWACALALSTDELAARLALPAVASVGLASHWDVRAEVMVSEAWK